MQYELFPPDPFSFFSLSSGSCGNCYYLGTEKYGILIDAGLGPRVIKKRLSEHDISLTSIVAVLITHDHYDHIKSVGHLGEKHFIPVYATRAVHRGIAANPMMRLPLNGSRRYIEKETTFRIHDLTITAFDVPHDSTENVGYHIQFGHQTLTLATDVGAVTERLAFYSAKANHLIIESNYDEHLLQKGSYPYQLKQRITNGTGHLSNRQAAEFLVSTYSSRLKNIWLCHLSGDNNHPELAYNTIAQMLEDNGIAVGSEVGLHVLKRNILSEKINL